MLHRYWWEEIKLVPFTTNILYEENCNFILTQTTYYIILQHEPQLCTESNAAKFYTQRSRFVYKHGDGPDFKTESFKSLSEILLSLWRVPFSERKLSTASLNAVKCKKLLLIWITNLHTSFDLIIELKKRLIAVFAGNHIISCVIFYVCITQ